MTRRKFLTDVQKAKEHPPTHIANVSVYDDEGVSFVYFYLSTDGRRQEVRLNLIVTDVDHYPSDSAYIVFTDDASVDPAIQNSLEHLQAIIDSMSVPDALEELSGGLHQATTCGRVDNPIVIDNDPPMPGITTPDSRSEVHPDIAISPDSSDFEDFEEIAGDSDDNFGFDSLPPSRVFLNKQSPRVVGNLNILRMKEDLRKAKDAGFKIGSYGDLKDQGIICISIRMNKLGISSEAMQAWGIDRKQYLVLLIRINHGYRTLSEIKDDRCLSDNTEIRVGVCDRYKPEREMSYKAFELADDRSLYEAQHPAKGGSLHSTGKLESLFIGRPLNELLRDRFAVIVKFRGFNLSWDGAEKFYNDTLGAKTTDLPKDLTRYRNLIDKGLSKKAFPAIVKADHLSHSTIENASLPLVAMQFVLRHFVRCTEFCLVCHCKLKDNFEALKPYVCSNQLCLYQFLALGIGPSVEWEIISQPYVVDLLISLCYCQTQAGRLKDFPLGISLRVPLLPQYNELSTPGYGRPPVQYRIPQVQEAVPDITTSFTGQLNHETSTLVLSDNKLQSPTVSSKDWVAIVSSSFETICHYRIAQHAGTTLHLIPSAAGKPKLKEPDINHEEWLQVDCYLYDQNYDELCSKHRHGSILAMLAALPSVQDIRAQLLEQQALNRDPELMSLNNIPPAARELMRWIIASNRSCIVQIDKVADSVTRKSMQISEDRVSGMQDYMQFRFAQGAPDKEQRFVDSIREHTVNSHHPTLFAWHGSPLYNWHSIIREGLNFDEIQHGRANGHGVYMSTHLQTSLNYTHGHPNSASGAVTPWMWSNSDLKVATVISLQEVVNNPASFVSINPHLVVAQKEWIQTRYLFVKTVLKVTPGADPEHCYKHDVQFPLVGPNRELVKIPLKAVSKAHKTTSSSTSSSTSKKLKIEQKSECADLADDDGASVATLEEDRKLCDPEDDDITISSNRDMLEALQVTNGACVKVQRSDQRKRKANDMTIMLDCTKTDFVPGTLDISNIKILPQPSYATTAASTALRRALAETVRTQKTTPAHEIGYYVDESKIENIYQWIVELHSFDPKIPLAKDMKQAGIKSIVLEMLFTAEFPYSPPFIRVIKPRFLPFLQGGGGHVTEGGAICMELLTTSGWTAATSIESTLVSIRLAMSESEHPARLLGMKAKYGNECYAIGDAISAYRRACMRHGWQTPKGLDDLARLT